MLLMPIKTVHKVKRTARGVANDAGEAETQNNAAKIDIITKVGQLNGKVNEAVETNKAAQSLKSAIESNYPDETDSLQKAIDAATDS